MFGTRSYLKAPLEDSHIITLQTKYPNIAQDIPAWKEILTQDCVIELLQFAAVCDMISRFLDGERGEGYMQYGVGYHLSALTKDHQGKMQTTEMQALHDVMVEAQMNTRWQEFLEVIEKRGVVIYSFHSCSSVALCPNNKALFIKEVGPFQKLRTQLDWDVETQLVSWDNVQNMSTLTDSEVSKQKELFSFVTQILKQDNLVYAPKKSLQNTISHS